MPRSSTSIPSTALPEIGTRKDEELTPLFNVVLLNDDEHTDHYVIEMLTKIFCLSVEAAFDHMLEVHTTGRSVIITCERPQAEFGRDQIHSYGADPRVPVSKGSMSAVVEPAQS
jgi:ATP-dependent Clp protease adaptor protein ClpS